MRIIGEIPHSIFKITVFKHEGKCSIKCEAGLLEQIYKFREDERLQTFEDIQKIVDEAFVINLELSMNSMMAARNQMLSRNLPLPEEEEFEKII